jgi:hypothetical protein
MLVMAHLPGSKIERSLKNDEAEKTLCGRTNADPRWRKSRPRQIIDGMGGVLGRTRSLDPSAIRPG